MEGLILFNRNALWNERGDLLLESTKFSKVSSTTPSKQANPAVDHPAAAPPTCAPLATAPPASAPPPCVAPDPTHEDEDPPLVIGHVTGRVQEAMDYVNMRHEIGQLTYVQMLAHLIRLQKSSDIFIEFATVIAEKPKAHQQRITAKNLFGNKGSAREP
jgi:hypothetical protein